MGSPTQNKAMLKVLQGFPTPCLERRAFQPTVGNANAQGLSNPDATNTACKLNSKAFSLVLIGLLACQWVDLEGLSSQHGYPTSTSKNTANLPAVGCSPFSWGFSALFFSGLVSFQLLLGTSLAVLASSQGGQVLLQRMGNLLSFQLLLSFFVQSLLQLLRPLSSFKKVAFFFCSMLHSFPSSCNLSNSSCSFCTSPFSSCFSWFLVWHLQRFCFPSPTCWLSCPSHLSLSLLLLSSSQQSWPNHCLHLQLFQLKKGGFQVEILFHQGFSCSCRPCRHTLLLLQQLELPEPSIFLLASGLDGACLHPSLQLHFSTGIHCLLVGQPGARHRAFLHQLELLLISRPNSLTALSSLTLVQHLVSGPWRLPPGLLLFLRLRTSSTGAGFALCSTCSVPSQSPSHWASSFALLPQTSPVFQSCLWQFDLWFTLLCLWLSFLLWLFLRPFLRVFSGDLFFFSFFCLFFFLPFLALHRQTKCCRPFPHLGGRLFHHAGSSSSRLFKHCRGLGHCSVSSFFCGFWAHKSHWEKKSQFFKDFFCFSWIFMCFHVSSRVFTGLHGSSWVFMGLHGSSWVFMGLHGPSWVFMCLHVFFCFFLIFCFFCRAVQPQDFKWGMPSLIFLGAVQSQDFKWGMLSLIFLGAVQPQDLKWGMPSLKNFGAVQPQDFKWGMPSLKKMYGWPTQRFEVRGCLPLKNCGAVQSQDFKWGMPSLKKM